MSPATDNPRHRQHRATAKARSSLPDPVGELRFQVDDRRRRRSARSRECSGLTVEYEVLEYQEGGENRFVHKFRGRLKYPNLVLKRGVTYEDALLKWFSTRRTATKRGTVTLTLLGADGKAVRSWAFAGAFPVKWQGPTLNAKSTNVATETLEIAHHGLVLQV